MTEETQNKQKNNSNIDSEKQEKLKHRAEVDAQDQELKNETPAELRKKLSNKNQDYVFRLEKELQLQGSMSREDAVAMTDKLLSEIIIAQRHGQPANGLYMAAPKLKAEEMLHPHKKPAKKPFWQLAVDGALLYVAIFVGLMGIIALFETKQTKNSQMGILSLASVGVLMGIFMVKYNDFIMPKNGQKPSWAKLILSGIAVAAVLFVWIWILQLPALQVINPILSGEADIIIAVVAFGIRYLFRKHYNITGSPFVSSYSNK